MNYIVNIITEDSDNSSDEVIDWLNFLSIKFRRRNVEYIFNPINDNLNEELINNYQQDDEPQKVESIWYRRPKRGILFPLEITEKHLLNPMFSPLNDKINYIIKNESQKLNEYILKKGKYLKQLGSHNRSEVNKYLVFELALNIGIDIPNTLLTNQQENLKDFYNHNNGKIVSKLHDILLGNVEEKMELYATYTEQISIDFINSLPERFHVSMFQELLEKDYEIRTFFINNQLYSMAIFSQLDNQTSLDFRRYNRSKMNRRIPYKLPLDLEKKLISLMQSLRLNTGSFDIVRTKDKRFVLLEVNPIGQFGMVSEPCNYYLYKKIAEFFKN